MLNLQHTVLEEIVTNDIALNFTESVLEICGIELEESGEYSCTASNGISTATVNNTANLTVIPGLCVGRRGGEGGGRGGGMLCLYSLDDKQFPYACVSVFWIKEPTYIGSNNHDKIISIEI